MVIFGSEFVTNKGSFVQSRDDLLGTPSGFGEYGAPLTPDFKFSHLMALIAW